jgi:hypothetical protein
VLLDDLNLPTDEESLAMFVLSDKKFFTVTVRGDTKFVDYSTYYITLLHISTNLWLIKDTNLYLYDKVVITMAGTNEITTLNKFDRADRVLFATIIQQYGYETP